MKIKWIHFWVFTVLFVSSIHEITELTQENFDTYMNQNEVFLTEFYSQTCFTCKNVMKELEKYIKLQKLEKLQKFEKLENFEKNTKYHNITEKNDSGISLSRIEGKQYSNISKRYNIKQFPAILLFVKDRIPVGYFGEREPSKILEFVELKLQYELEFLAESKDIRNAIEQNEVCIVYGGRKENDEYSILKGVAWLYDDIKFYFSPLTELSVETKEGVKLALFKKYDERITFFTNFRTFTNFSNDTNFTNDTSKNRFSLENLRYFIDSNYLPIVMPFTNKYSDHLFFKLKRSIFLFTELESEKSEKSKNLAGPKLQKVFYEVAKANRGKFYFFITDLKQTNVEENLQKFLRIKTESFPRIEIIDPDEVLSRYVFGANNQINDQINDKVNNHHIGKDPLYISFEDLIMFIGQFESGSLKRFLKSEDPPDYYNKNNRDAVLKIVGLTWQEKVINNKKDVLIKFHVPWCSICPTFAPIFSHMAELLLPNNKNLFFGEIDLTENDLPGIQFQEYPAIMLFPINNKQNPIQYKGNRTIEDMILFLKDKVTVPLNISKYEKWEKWSKWPKNGDL